MDVIEINEAFAAQVLACLKGLGLPLATAMMPKNGRSGMVAPHDSFAVMALRSMG